MIIGAAIFFVVPFNTGIDFQGGSSIEVQARDGVADVGDVRNRLLELDLGEVQVQEFGNPQDVLVRIGIQDGDDSQQQVAVAQVTDEVSSDYEVRRTEAVSGTVSGELAMSGTIGKDNDPFGQLDAALQVILGIGQTEAARLKALASGADAKAWPGDAVSEDEHGDYVLELAHLYVALEARLVDALA